MGDAFYTYTALPGWEDVSATVKAGPEFAKIQTNLTSKGATSVGITAYVSQDAQVTILFSAMTDDDGGEAMIAGFDKGARGSLLSAGHEDSYKVDKTTSMHVSTQRVSSNGMKTLSVRYAGMAKGSGLTAIAFNCTAPEEATCDQAYAALHVDGDKFTPLSDLPSQESRLQYAFGVGVGISVVLLFVAYRIWKSRRIPA